METPKVSQHYIKQRLRKAKLFGAFLSHRSLIFAVYTYLHHNLQVTSSLKQDITLLTTTIEIVLTSPPSKPDQKDKNHLRSIDTYVTDRIETFFSFDSAELSVSMGINLMDSPVSLLFSFAHCLQPLCSLHKTHYDLQLIQLLHNQKRKE